MIPAELLQQLPFYLRAEVEEHQVRKDFTQSEIAAAQEVMRQTWSKKFRPGRKDNSPDSVSLGDVSENAAQLDDILGDAFDEGREVVRKRRAIFRAAQEDPDRFGGLVDEMDELNKVEPVYRKLQELGPPSSTKIQMVRRNFRLSPDQEAIVEEAFGICGGDPTEAFVEICRYYVIGNR